MDSRSQGPVPRNPGTHSPKILTKYQKRKTCYINLPVTSDVAFEVFCHLDSPACVRMSECVVQVSAYVYMCNKCHTNPPYPHLPISVEGTSLFWDAVVERTAQYCPCLQTSPHLAAEARLEDRGGSVMGAIPCTTSRSHSSSSMSNLSSGSSAIFSQETTPWI